MKCYLLRKRPLDKLKVSPCIPDNFFTENGYEDAATPRVCLAHSIDDCLVALSQNLKGARFFVSEVEVDEKDLYRPSTSEVPDVEVTGEVWVLDDVEVVLLGRIEVVGDDGCPGRTFSYGDDITAELYGWRWRWVEGSRS